MWEKIINHVKNKNSIEIGGPSEMFMHQHTHCLLYPFLDNIDGANMENLWQGDIKSNFNPYFNKNGNCYRLDITNEKDYKNVPKKYDLVFSTHVLEHSANPIKALILLKNLLNHNGMILTIIPNKTEFWDKTRETTTMYHLLEDYKNNVLENDLTHLKENYHDRDWSLGGVDGRVIKSKEHYLELALNNVENRVMHHHCFDLKLVKDMHEYCGYKTIECFTLPNDNLHLIYLGSL